VPPVPCAAMEPCPRQAQPVLNQVQLHKALESRRWYAVHRGQHVGQVPANTHT
jgi:hypothetical protein